MIRRPSRSTRTDTLVPYTTLFRARFAIVKHYGAHRRRITRPVTGSVRVAVDGEETAAFTIEPGGWSALGEAPAVGAVVTAGFAFDVPVRVARSDGRRVGKAGCRTCRTRGAKYHEKKNK